MSSKFKKKIAERSTEELLNLLREERDSYPREVVSIIEEVLDEREVDYEQEMQKKSDKEESLTVTETHRRISSSSRQSRSRTPSSENVCSNRIRLSSFCPMPIFR